MEDKTGDWIRWCYTTIEGGNVPAHEIEAARAQLDSRTFRQEFEASFENLTGLVAVSFGDENIPTEAKDIKVLPLLLGVDLNVDPMSGICAVKDNETLYVFDEIMLRGGATTWDFAEEVVRRYGVDRRVIACPDPTGRSRRAAAPQRAGDTRAVRGRDTRGLSARCAPGRGGPAVAGRREARAQPARWGAPVP